MLLESETILVGQTQIGNFAYFSPEMINGELPSFASDIWALGVITYRLLTNRFPFGDPENKSEYINRLVKGEFDEIDGEVSEDLKDLCKRMLSVDSAQRVTIEDIKKHALIFNNIP